MQPDDLNERIPHQGRRFLFAAIAAISVSGCAMSPDRLRPESSSGLPENALSLIQPSPATDTVAVWGNRANTVQTVGYTEGLALVAAPVRFAPQSDDDSRTDNAKEPDDRGELGATEDSESDDDSNVDFVDPIELPLDSAVGTQQPADYFVQLALGRHPEIQAARQRVAAATNVIPQVRALPDPVLSNTFWPIHDLALQTAAGRVGHQFGLSQGVPWPEKLRTKAAIANREVQMAQAEVDRIGREITEAVRLAYYEVWYSTRAIAIVEEMRDLVEMLTQTAESRNRAGGSQQDVLRAQLETDRLDDQLIALARQKEVAQADLSALVQQPVSLIPEATSELGLTNVPEQLDGLLVLAEQCSPELRAIAWEIQRDRQKHKLACLQKYPDLQLGMNYSILAEDNNVISPVANGYDNISFTFGTSLPIWRNKINAGIREAAYRTDSSTRRLEAQRDTIYGKLRRLMAQADALVEQQDIYGDRIIPRTEDTLTLALADYRGKRTDFFSLIETFRELLIFEMQLARFEATLAGTIAQIERTVGCPYQSN